nr:hypothetical protein [Pontibacillus yanchengensis]
MPQTVIFDMDGTLFQIEKILEQSLDDTFHYLRLLEKWDAETPINTYRNIMGVPLPKVWETLLPHHSQDIREQDMVNEDLRELDTIDLPEQIRVLK